MQRKTISTFLCLFLLLGLLCTAACARSGTYEKGEGTYTVSGERASDQDAHTLSMRAGDRLKVSCDREEGTLAVTIGQAGQAPLYRSNGLESGAFIVTVQTDGVYTIEVRMDAFTGRATFVVEA